LDFRVNHMKKLQKNSLSLIAPAFGGLSPTPKVEAI
jgi:hypothetical protein